MLGSVTRNTVPGPIYRSCRLQQRFAGAAPRTRERPLSYARVKGGCSTGARQRGRGGTGGHSPCRYRAPERSGDGHTGDRPAGETHPALGPPPPGAAGALWPRPAPRAPAEVAHAEAAERPPGFRSGAGPARARPPPAAMLRGLGSWLGLERAGEEQLLPAGERSGPAEREEEQEAGLAGQEQGELQGDSEALLSQAKGFGSECPAAKETRLQVCLSVIASFRAVFKGVACLKYLFCWQCGRRSVWGENRSVYVE